MTNISSLGRSFFLENLRHNHSHHQPLTLLDKLQLDSGTSFIADPRRMTHRSFDWLFVQPVVFLKFMHCLAGVYLWAFLTTIFSTFRSKLLTCLIVLNSWFQWISIGVSWLAKENFNGLWWTILSHCALRKNLTHISFYLIGHFVQCWIEIGLKSEIIRSEMLFFKFNMIG